ncbi:hypothetical protein BX616_004190 [Lobosporangium transversale]|uniref:Uncharacterized protein n=1 Tax=Lobosporangium transversale TaxID=64571 RepID=A0A1Y2GP57_9FUNG|nr:hypothetical protein BCR41DRAFT_355438 [Lobosporangium transversale]KAF9918918.1 hypothetical protein BX616_004190 [Lobosporangium transversale]ORZ13322.1 hypothetical protein BCR41DRAFT_355438 [Lobosporangium transversale]|eukprot:XP_021880403.1 hypothetical protein BCR41DRAFT_355438 [Lobosporangium transversale]
MATASVPFEQRFVRRARAFDSHQGIHHGDPQEQQQQQNIQQYELLQEQASNQQHQEQSQNLPQAQQQTNQTQSQSESLPPLSSISASSSSVDPSVSSTNLAPTTDNHGPSGGSTRGYGHNFSKEEETYLAVQLADPKNASVLNGPPERHTGDKRKPEIREKILKAFNEAFSTADKPMRVLDWQLKNKIMNMRRLWNEVHRVVISAHSPSSESFKEKIIQKCHFYYIMEDTWSKPILGVNRKGTKNNKTNEILQPRASYYRSNENNAQNNQTSPQNNQTNFQNKKTSTQSNQIGARNNRVSSQSRVSSQNTRAGNRDNGTSSQSNENNVLNNRPSSQSNEASVQSSGFSSQDIQSNAYWAQNKEEMAHDNGANAQGDEESVQGDKERAPDNGAKAQDSKERAQDNETRTQDNDTRAQDNGTRLQDNDGEASEESQESDREASRQNTSRGLAQLNRASKRRREDFNEAFRAAKLELKQKKIEADIENRRAKTAAKIERKKIKAQADSDEKKARTKAMLMRLETILKRTEIDRLMALADLESHQQQKEKDEFCPELI